MVCHVCQAFIRPGGVMVVKIGLIYFSGWLAWGDKASYRSDFKENLGWRDARQQVWLDSDERNAEYNLPPIPLPIATLIATRIAALGAAYPETETYSRAESFNCKWIPRDMGQSLQDPGICVLSIDPARPKFGGGKTTYFRGFGLNIRVKESKIEGVNGVFWPNLTPNRLCWFCFRSYLRTKALHFYYYLLLALLSFVSANKSNPL